MNRSRRCFFKDFGVNRSGSLLVAWLFVVGLVSLWESCLTRYILLPPDCLRDQECRLSGVRLLIFPLFAVRLSCGSHTSRTFLVLPTWWGTSGSHFDIGWPSECFVLTTRWCAWSCYGRCCGWPDFVREEHLAPLSQIWQLLDGLGLLSYEVKTRSGT